ncbi:hypothetical protein Shyd_94010 [Streptomyces hydrogenans]|uniref:Uncharacterized protein n=1 Tax=Streptomyces hydrogenans TaxID=1873719 RepID=A0ABQ3PSN5_9ACTN|nr:hypothetical protein Shyd_94010 [Streptomyces hydrogenans]
MMHLRFRKDSTGCRREWTGLYTTGENGERAPRAVDLAWSRKPRHRSPYAPTPAGVVEFKAVYAHEARSDGQLNAIYQKVFRDVEKSLTWHYMIMGEVFSWCCCRTCASSATVFPTRSCGRSRGRSPSTTSCAGPARSPMKQPCRRCPGTFLGSGRCWDGLIDAGTESGVRVTVPYVILGSVPVETYENLPSLKLVPRQRGQRGK